MRVWGKRIYIYRGGEEKDRKRETVEKKQIRIIAIHSFMG